MYRVMILANAKSPLIKNWLQINSKKYQIILISIYPKEDYIKDVVFERIYSKYSKIFSYVKLLFRIKRIIKKYNPDIIFSHYIIHHGVITALSRFHPHISVGYGSDLFDLPIIMRFLIKYVLKSSEHTLVTTQFTKEYLINKIKANGQKLSVEHTGIDLDIFNLDKRTTKLFQSKIIEQYQLSLNHKYIISPRIIRPVYNHEMIIKGFSEINKEYPEYKLIMLYFLAKKHKKYYEKLKRITKKLDLEEKIIWINRIISPLEMADLLSLSEIMIHIPKHDQLAATLLEGIACGCFPIVCNLNSYLELIKNNQNGIILENLKVESIVDAFNKYLDEKVKFKYEIEKTALRIKDQYDNHNFSEHLEEIINNWCLQS